MSSLPNYYHSENVENLRSLKNEQDFVILYSSHSKWEMCAKSLIISNPT